MDYAADFETTTNPYDCRVWAWGVCEVGKPETFVYGNTLEGFMEFVEEHSETYHFHNAAFDCEFIIYHLLTSGFTHTTKSRLNEREFKTLISSNGKFYQMEVCFSKQGKKKAVTAVFKDSLKKLPMSVDAVAKSFDLPLEKLNIDYEEYREYGHDLTDEEVAYLRNDVVIMALALDHQFKQGLTRLTIGADALSSYRDIMGGRWKQLFPVLPIPMDAAIRKAYKGGYTYANPNFQADEENPDRINGAGSVYDVNSLYPSVMYDRYLPVGQPKYFHGRYEKDDERPLYIQFLTAHCKLRPGKLPTLQIKNSAIYCETEYITETDGAVDLSLTNIDLEILMEHYEVTVLSYNGGFSFRARKGLFTEYIDFWTEIKQNNTGGLRLLAKLMLNSLYGKFATNPDVTGKIPILKESGAVGYMLGEEETRDPVYTPMGCFITAHARQVTITAAQKNYKRFMYADTDSLHVIGTEPIEGVEVHPFKLGYWKHESDFSRAKYVRAKTYIERITHHGALDENGNPVMEKVDDYDDVKCAGLPKDLKKNVTFENFKRGLVIHGKLRPRHVPGGIVLEKTDFTLK